MPKRKITARLLGRYARRKVSGGYRAAKKKAKSGYGATKAHVKRNPYPYGGAVIGAVGGGAYSYGKTGSIAGLKVGGKKRKTRKRRR